MRRNRARGYQHPPETDRMEVLRVSYDIDIIRAQDLYAGLEESSNAESVISRVTTIGHLFQGLKTVRIEISLRDLDCTGASTDEEVARLLVQFVQTEASTMLERLRKAVFPSSLDLYHYRPRRAGRDSYTQEDPIAMIELAESRQAAKWCADIVNNPTGFLAQAFGPVSCFRLTPNQ